MQVRPATHADMPAMLKLGQEFLTTTPYAAVLANNPDKMVATCGELIDSPAGAVFVSTDLDDQVTGLIGLKCFEHPLSGERTVGELFWWVSPTARGRAGLALLRRAERWAKEMQAVKIQMVSPSVETSQLYEKLDYVPIEISYQKAL